MYLLAKLIFPSLKYCYGLNYDAKLLCDNRTAVDQFKIQELEFIFANLKNPDGEVAKLL